VKRHFAAWFVWLIFLIIGVPTVRPATITWTNTSGGNWSDAANWSPNQLPTNNDSVLITIPGSYSVTLDVSGVATNLTLGAGGGAAGVQTLVASNMLTVYSLALVTAGGVLNSSGDDAGFSGAMTIANGGVLNLAAGYDNFTYTANPLIVTSGGMVSAGGSPLYGGYGGTEYYYGSTINGTVSVAGGGVFNSLGASVAAVCTVAQGGEVNVNSLGLAIKEPLTNSGTINLTDGQLGDENYNSVDGAAYGELVNQPGGVINLQGSTSIGGGGYIINQGAIVQSAGTNAINSPVIDNRLGTITNLSGIMTLGLIQTNLTGTDFADAGATIQFRGADIVNDNSASQLTLGTPFVLDGSGQYQLTSGYLYLPTNVPPNLELMGDTLQLGPSFQGGAITNLTLDGIELLNALPITGSLAATNSVISTNLTVANGGVLSATGSALFQGLAVEGGGVANVNNAFFLGFGAIITVAHAGTMNVEGPVVLIPSLTNAGTLNLTSPITFGGTFGGGTYEGVNNGILNQAGGLINLGSNAGIIIPYPFSATTNYFINQGAIVQNAGIGATNTINVSASVFDFDNSQGAVTNLSGTLILAFLQGPLTGTFYAAAGATIQLGGGTAATPLQPGVLGGSGQLQFISGYLYALANVPPNLSLQGGLLELGPGFQDGAITNLTLDGMELTNQLSTTLPIKGKFTVLNSGGYVPGYYGPVLSNTGVYGNYVVVNGGFLSLSNAAMYGAVTVMNGGVLNAESSFFPYGNLTVAGGGVVNSSGSTYGAVTVASGGLFDSLDTFSAYFGFGPSSSIYGPMTNSGTINLTNSAIDFYNDGTTNFQGCLINQAGGLIDFWGNTGIGGSGGYAYLVNQGQITKSGGSSFSGFGFNLATNSGMITAQTGQMVLGNQWTLLPSGSLNVVLNSATNYGSFIISTNSPVIVGNAALAGAFNVTLNNGYVPANGTTFDVLSYGSFTGSFSSLGLPAAVSWQSNYGVTNFSLVAGTGSGSPHFGIVKLLGTNLIFDGTGGEAGSNYVILASTNLALPLTEWTALLTNAFDGTGQFQYTNTASPANRQEYFILKSP